MKSRRRRSSRSSTGCARVDLPLPTAPGLALLLGIHAAGLPLWLLFAPVEHGVAAALGCLALALLAAPSVARLCLARGARAPRRLSFTADGLFRLDLAGGFSEDVVPSGRTLHAGPWWVLVLAGSRARHYVLVETRRVDAARLAALGRALRRVAAGPDEASPAIRWLMDPGRPVN